MRLSPTTPNGLRIFAIEPVWAIWTSSAMPTPSSREPFQRDRTAFEGALATPEGHRGADRPSYARREPLSNSAASLPRLRRRRRRPRRCRRRSRSGRPPPHGDHDLAAALRVGVADEGPGAGQSLRECVGRPILTEMGRKRLPVCAVLLVEAMAWVRPPNAVQ